jgi:hypothetical protein
VILADGWRKENWVLSGLPMGFSKVLVLYSMGWSLVEASRSSVVSFPNEAFRHRPRALHSRHSPQFRCLAWIRGC